MCTILFCLSMLYVNVELSEPGYNAKYNEGMWCTNHFCRGPQATVKVGMPILVNERTLIYYGFKHTSFINEPHDKGQNTPFVSITWVPFR